MLSRIKNYFKRVTCRSTDQQVEMVKTILTERFMSNILFKDHLKLVTTYGPTQIIIKLNNTLNLRMLRIEIPRKYEDDNIHLFEQLEKTHNIEEDIEKFYRGSGEYVSFPELLDLLEDAEIEKWFTEYVDRDCDIDRIPAKKITSLGDIKPEKGYLSYARIEEVKLQKSFNNGAMLHLKFEGIKEYFPVNISHKDINLYKPGRIFVMNHMARFTAFTFNNVKKFMIFNHEEWQHLLAKKFEKLPHTSEVN